MGIQKLDPKEESEDNKMSTIQKLDPKEESEDNKISTSELDYINQQKQTGLVVATLISTVTFTAGFTVPGGFKSEGVDEGMAALSKRTAFRVFLIANTLAFGLSIASVFIHFSYSTLPKEVVFLKVRLALMAPTLTFYSALALLVAFISGTYTVVPHHMGITTAIIICCCVLSICCFLIIYGLACCLESQWNTILLLIWKMKEGSMEELFSFFNCYALATWSGMI